MDKLIKPGRIIFSLGIIALGVLCFVSKDFIVGRPPLWPATWNLNPALAYISGTLLIVAAIAIIIEKGGRFAASLIAVLIFFLSLLRCLPHFTDGLNWLAGFKIIGLFGGALVVVASFYTKRKKLILITIGSMGLASFFIACGYAHFKYATFTKDFIPAYIPFRIFWTYFCAICLFAGGAGILIPPPIGKWAALLSGIMLLGWFLLLHIPRFIANTNDASDRLGLCESFTFAGIFFVLAGLLSKKEG